MNGSESKFVCNKAKITATNGVDEFLNLVSQGSLNVFFTKKIN